MRSIIALVAVLAALGGQGALADERAGESPSNPAPPFAEDGVYIAAGDTVEVVIAGKCHRFTNHDKRIGFVFSPSEPNFWPSRAPSEPMEPKVTEEPCK